MNFSEKDKRQDIWACFLLSKKRGVGEAGIKLQVVLVWFGFFPVSESDW